MTTPDPARRMYCHGLECEWNGPATELNRSDSSKPPSCPKCGSYTPSTKIRKPREAFATAPPAAPAAADPPLAAKVDAFVEALSPNPPPIVPREPAPDVRASAQREIDAILASPAPTPSPAAAAPAPPIVPPPAEVKPAPAPMPPRESIDTQQARTDAQLEAQRKKGAAGGRPAAVTVELPNPDVERAAYQTYRAAVLELHQAELEVHRKIAELSKSLEGPRAQFAKAQRAFHDALLADQPKVG